MGRALILLSNDDGVRASGLACLREALLEIGDVVVVAPEQEQSASSHAISLHRPLRFTTHGDSIFSVEGTPADCVYTALFGGTRFLPRTPDVVISGMNRGLNLAGDVHYSGTVAAAREAAIRGVRAIAFSADTDADLRSTCRVARRLVTSVIEEDDRSAILLNVNFPPGAKWPLVVTRLGSRIYRDGVEFRQDPRGREYIWLGGPPGVRHLSDADTDTGAFERGCASVTPLELLPSAHGQLDRVRLLLESINVVDSEVL
jgi:5'-nucleotidase